jgi:uncharacterized membrane protein HdeD (DUF308 family)
VARSLSSHPGESEGVRTGGIRHVWLLPAFNGLLTFVCGVLVLALPDVSLLTAAVLVGTFLIVVGVLRFAAAFALPAPDYGRLLPALGGIVTTAAGIFVIARPGDTARGVAVVLGCWLIVLAVAGFTRSAIAGERRGRTFVLSLIDLAAGILLVVWPHIAVATVVIVIGVYLIWAGLGQLLVALTLRRLERPLARAI